MASDWNWSELNKKKQVYTLSLVRQKEHLRFVKHEVELPGGNRAWHLFILVGQGHSKLDQFQRAYILSNLLVHWLWPESEESSELSVKWYVGFFVV